MKPLYRDNDSLGCCWRLLYLLSVCVHPVHCQCSANLTATETYQELTSPGYPSDYEPDLTCEWNILANNASFVIQLIFLDLSTEDHGICLTDYVAIYDGDPSYSTTLGRYCGTKTPDTMLTTQSLLVVYFRTNSFKHSKGFKAKYKAGPESSFLQTGDDSSNSSSAFIIGAAVGSVVVIVATVTASLLVYKYIKSRKPTRPRSSSHSRRRVTSSRVQPYGIHGNVTCVDYFGNEPPPAYTEIDEHRPMSPPPAYSDTA